MLAWGMVVSLATWLVVGEGFVRFGILHLIGVSMLLAYPFLIAGVWNLALGVMLVTAGALLPGVTIDFPWLLWLGLRPSGFYTVDYFPLLPWFGVVLIGLFLGAVAYRDYRRRLPLLDLTDGPSVRLLGWLGQRSLSAVNLSPASTGPDHRSYPPRVHTP